MRVYHDFFLVPGSRSTFPEVDPDPAQRYGSDRIRIRNTSFMIFLIFKILIKEIKCFFLVVQGGFDPPPLLMVRPLKIFFMCSVMTTKKV